MHEQKHGQDYYQLAEEIKINVLNLKHVNAGSYNNPYLMLRNIDELRQARLCDQINK